MTHYATVAPNQTIELGECKITHICDGWSYAPLQVNYPTSTLEGWESYEEFTDGNGNMLLPLGGFMVEIGDKKVLVDLAMGSQAFIDEAFPGFGIEAGRYLDGLEAIGVKPENVTDVFITHMHMD